MSESEKKRKDDMNLTPAQGTPKPPEFETVIPDIEEYQEKIEREWQSAKQSYESNINKIMNDFLKENISDITREKPHPEPTYKSPPKHDPERLSRLLAHVEKEIQTQIKPKGFSFLSGMRPPIINIPMHSPKVFSFKSLILALMLITGAATTWFFSSYRISAVTELPYAHATGPIIADGKIYIADWFRKAIYVHAMKKGLPIVSVENVPNNFITGFAISDSGLWTVDGFDNQILLHTNSLDHRMVKKSPTPEKKPVGIFWDGTDVWTADNISQKIYRHRDNDLQDIRDVYAFPEKTTVAGFQLKDNRLWVLDGNSREIVVYRLQQPLKKLAAFDLDPFLEGATPTGMAIEGKNIWAVTINPTKAIRISRNKLEKTNPQDF